MRYSDVNSELDEFPTESRLKIQCYTYIIYCIIRLKILNLIPNKYLRMSREAVPPDILNVRQRLIIMK